MTQNSHLEKLTVNADSGIIDKIAALSKRLRVSQDQVLSSAVCLGLLTLENSRQKDDGNIETIVVNPRISPDFEHIQGDPNQALALRELITVIPDRC